MTFGFLAANALGPDFYNPSNDGDTLVGRRTKERIGLNDRLHVIVGKVDRVKRMIDFKRVDGRTGNPVGSTRDLGPKVERSKRPPKGPRSSSRNPKSRRNR